MNDLFSALKKATDSIRALREDEEQLSPSREIRIGRCCASWRGTGCGKPWIFWTRKMSRAGVQRLGGRPWRSSASVGSVSSRWPRTTRADAETTDRRVRYLNQLGYEYLRKIEVEKKTLAKIDTKILSARRRLHSLWKSERAKENSPRTSSRRHEWPRTARGWKLQCSPASGRLYLQAATPRRKSVNDKRLETQDAQGP